MRKPTKPRFAPLGSVSSGTTRPEDLIPRFLDVAEGLRLSREDRKTVVRIRHDSNNALWADEHSQESDGYWTLQADSDLEALFDLLSNYAPPYCYFGAHEGDGADYGFWVSLTPGYDHDNVWIDPQDGSRMPREGYDYRLVISDHGNMTLYYRNGREVWGVV
jgi:hypothetical protein